MLDRPRSTKRQKPPEHPGGFPAMIAIEPISFSCDGSFSAFSSACAWQSYVFFFFVHKAL
jgi:hypothetical protein